MDWEMLNRLSPEYQKEELPNGEKIRRDVAWLIDLSRAISKRLAKAESNIDEPDEDLEANV